MKNRTKKINAMLLAALLAAGPAAYADEWHDKLSRGLINIISSPVEIGRTVYNVSESEGAAEGWTLGLLKGVGRTLVRIGAGLVEVVTFPFDFPDEDKEPLMDPEYAWQGSADLD